MTRRMSEARTRRVERSPPVISTTIHNICRTPKRKVKVNTNFQLPCKSPPLRNRKPPPWKASGKSKKGKEDGFQRNSRMAEESPILRDYLQGAPRQVGNFQIILHTYFTYAYFTWDIGLKEKLVLKSRCLVATQYSLQPWSMVIHTNNYLRFGKQMIQLKNYSKFLIKQMCSGLLAYHADGQASELG